MSAFPARPIGRRTALTGAAAGAATWMAPAAVAGEHRTSDVFVITGATVFDGQRSLGCATVMVAGARTVAVGPHLTVPGGVPVVDGRGKTVLPGLVDAHVHAVSGLSPDPPRFGVTTELDMFNFYDVLGPYRRRRASTDTARMSDLWTAGTLATVPGGHGTEFGEIPTLDPDAGRAACEDFVARRLAEGTDHLKVILDDGSLFGARYPTLTPTQVGHLIDAAHRRGARCVVHVTRQQEAGVAADLGADVLAHVPGDPMSDRVVDTIRASGTVVTPTLAVYNGMSCTGAEPALAADPRVSPFLTPEQRTKLTTPYPSCLPEIYPAASRNVGWLHEAGVPLLAGTDVGNPALARGVSLLSELSLLTDAGLSSVDALRAATGEVARRFPIGSRGRIAPGHRADLVLVHGDATSDVSRVRDIDRVWRNGHPVARQPTIHTG